jgi:hypothetical protein
MRATGRQLLSALVALGVAGSAAPASAQLFGIGAAFSVTAGEEADATGATEAASLDAGVTVPELGAGGLRRMALAFAEEHLAELFQEYYDGPNRKSEAAKICEAIDRRRAEPGARALLELVRNHKGDLQALDWYRSHRAAIDDASRFVSGTFVNGATASDTYARMDALAYARRVSKERGRHMVYDAKRFVDGYLRPTFPELEGAPYDNR